MIFASSIHAVSGYAADVQVKTTDPVNPGDLYGVSKCFGEALGRYYSEEFGLSVICLRIGTCNRVDRPEDAREFATLLSHADLVRLVECCLQAPASVRYAVYFGVSDNTWRFWDLAPARDQIGYEPRDDAERWRMSAPAQG